MTITVRSNKLSGWTSAGKKATSIRLGEIRNGLAIDGDSGPVIVEFGGSAGRKFTDDGGSEREWLRVKTNGLMYPDSLGFSRDRGAANQSDPPANP